MNIIIIILAIIWIAISLLYAYYEGSKRKLGFIGCLLLMIIFTPFFGYFIIESFSQNNAKGCIWCWNKYNEAEYCGLCKKNEEGELKILKA